MDFHGGEFIYINKPYRMSSFGALAYVRTRLSRALHVKRLKTGHAGTLDPLATGVLILCTGKATKRIESLQLASKEYTTVNMTYSTRHITRELIESVLPQFVGDIQQVPPIYSAVMVDGHRAYTLARQGSEAELKAKTIHIDEIELTDFNPETMQMSIRVACGKGTYIRSLARDIGEALGSGAFLTALCRTRLGDVRIEDCLTLDEFPAWLEDKIPSLKTQ